ETTVRALVDAATGLDGVARVLLAGAGPDLLRVRRRDRERAHRHTALVIEDRTERHAIVRGLPDAARGRSHEERLRRTGDTGDVGDASFEVRRTDGTPSEAGERQ